jgi:hypothetical protein
MGVTVVAGALLVPATAAQAYPTNCSVYIIHSEDDSGVTDYCWGGTGQSRAKGTCEMKAYPYYQFTIYSAWMPPNNAQSFAWCGSANRAVKADIQYSN